MVDSRLEKERLGARRARGRGGGGEFFILLPLKFLTLSIEWLDFVGDTMKTIKMGNKD